MALPRKLKAFAVFASGIHLAEAETITLPKLARETEDWRGGGMSGPVKIDKGLQALSMEAAMKGLSVEAYTEFSATVLSGSGLRFVGVHEEDDTGQLTQVEISVRGRASEIDGGQVKMGDAGTTTLKLDLTYYRLEVNGKEQVEIDLINGVERYRGKDANAATRALLTL